MTHSKLPWAFRITAALIVAAIIVGGWWQRQPAGENGRAFLAIVARACPAAAPTVAQSTVADTAHALDRWGYAVLGNLVFRDERDRCAAGISR